MLIPSKSEFLRLTGESSSMAVYREVLADMETPLSAYWKLAHDERYSFLLESVTGGEQLARYSVLGVRPRTVLRTKNGTYRKSELAGESEGTIPDGQDPLDLLEEAMRRVAPIPVQGLPAFAGGAVGMMGYDLARCFERLPDTTHDDLQTDDLAMMLVDTLLVFDHAKNLIRVIVMTDGSAESYDQAELEVDDILRKLAKPLPPLPQEVGPAHAVHSNMTREEYEAAVRKAIEYIGAGDGIQMVPSQRFSTKVDAAPISVYRALRSLNPSPYMFLLRFGDFDLVGASPELLVSLHGRKARVRPIAGTRPRGQNEEEDHALAAELLADEKERAEHIMLVDLGRNDLGRVCEYGTVKVNELMVVERYSHVMHIVSDVTGELARDKDAYDLIRASFPAGTVSGAPKVRAMEIIDELEPTRRGSYAGAVGFVSSTGDVDLCITIRTIFIKNGIAYVQAGAGIVYDSDPGKEYEESCNKAKACLKAIEKAQEVSEIRFPRDKGQEIRDKRQEIRDKR